MKRVLLCGFVAIFLAVACSENTIQPNEEPTTPPQGENPKKTVKQWVQLNLDLSQSAADARAMTINKTYSKAIQTFDSIRFRVVYEIKSDSLLIQGDTLFNISSSVVRLHDSLPYGRYRFALFANYVITDPSGNIVREQYRVDTALGLAKISIVAPDKPMEWAFAYSGNVTFEVNERTTEVSTPIVRQVFQMAFQVPYPFGLDGANPQGYCRTDAVLTNFSDSFNAYEGKAFCTHPQITLNDLRHVDTRYYQLTFFETLENCSIDVSYRTQTGEKSAPFRTLHNNELHSDGSRVYWFLNPFAKNYRYTVSTGMVSINNLMIDNSVRIQDASTRLIGDNEIFKSQEASDVLESDSLALVDLFRSLGGVNWNQKWNLLVPISGWSGITLSSKEQGKKQRVEAVQLCNPNDPLWSSNANYMAGRLPASVGQLTALKKLYLSADFSKGIDPSVFMGIGQLEELFLVQAPLVNYSSSNDIWPEVVLGSGLTKLKKVLLMKLKIKNANQLWHNELLQSAVIQVCQLSDNEVLFETVESLPELKELEWGVFGVHTVSDRFYRLAALEGLALSGGKHYDLARMIASFPDIRDLRVGAMGSLKDQVIPTSIKSLAHLGSLTFDHTMIQGTIPSELFEMQELRYLSLSEPNLEGELPQKIKYIQSLTISSSKMTGTLPLFPDDVWGISFRWNNFTGNIPEAYATYANLRSLWLQGNRLTGKVPPALKNHKHWSLWNPQQEIYPQKIGYGLTD